jgi:hypothetical protein
MTDLEVAYRFATSELPVGWTVSLEIGKKSALVRLTRNGIEVPIKSTGNRACDLISDAVRTAQALTSSEINDDPIRESHV